MKTWPTLCFHKNWNLKVTFASAENFIHSHSNLFSKFVSKVNEIIEHSYKTKMILSTLIWWISAIIFAQVRMEFFSTAQLLADSVSYRKTLYNSSYMIIKWNFRVCFHHLYFVHPFKFAKWSKVKKYTVQMLMIIAAQIKKKKGKKLKIRAQLIQ